MKNDTNLNAFPFANLSYTTLITNHQVL